MVAFIIKNLIDILTSGNISQTSGKQFPIVTSTPVNICILIQPGWQIATCTSNSTYVTNSSCITNVMYKKIRQCNAPKNFNQRCRVVARWWVLWRGKVVSFEVMFEGVKWWWDSDSSTYMIATDLWSSRGERTTFKVGFYPGNMQLFLYCSLKLLFSYLAIKPQVWNKLRVQCVQDGLSRGTT